MSNQEQSNENQENNPEQEKAQSKTELSKSQAENEDTLALRADHQKGKWTLRKQENRQSAAESGANEVQFQVPLPKGAGLVIRLREDARLPSDKEAPLRVVWKFPAPEQANEAKQSEASSETKQDTTNGSVGGQ